MNAMVNAGAYLDRKVPPQQQQDPMVRAAKRLHIATGLSVEGVVSDQAVQDEITIAMALLPNNGQGQAQVQPPWVQGLEARLNAKITASEGRLRGEITAANNQLRGEITASRNQLQGGINLLDVAVRQCLDNDNEVRARLAIIETRRQNRLSFGPGNNEYSLIAPLKIVAGYGAGLPPHPNDNNHAQNPINVAHLPNPVLTVGAAVSSPLFPITRERLGKMTYDDLSLLSALYNEDFGIVAADNLGARKTKFQDFLM